MFKVKSMTILRARTTYVRSLKNRRFIFLFDAMTSLKNVLEKEADLSSMYTVVV